jgi:hypothetical protein
MNKEKLELLITKAKDLQSIIGSAEREIYGIKKTIEEKIKEEFNAVYVKILPDSLCDYAIEIKTNNEEISFIINIKFIDKKCMKEKKWYHALNDNWRYKECLPPCNEEKLEELIAKATEACCVAKVIIEEKSYINIVGDT